MSNEIKKLPDKVCDQISAGEVIERPASVVKELVENSVDASSDRIEVEIEEGGRKLIRVRDNGIGFPPEQIERAFSRYTTSKIENINDIYSLNTLGFRGEALASIAAVSRLEVKSRQQEADRGVILKLEAGEKKEKSTAGLPPGTEIKVKDLFFNTPARYKHLKKETTETYHVNKAVTSAALAYPGITFDLYQEGNKNFSTPGDDNLKNTIFSLYGEDVYKNLISVDFSRDYLQVKGFLVNPEVSRSSREHQFFFVNNRPVKNKHLRQGIERACQGFLKDNRYPIFFINIEINPVLVDVNVHPDKKRIKLSRAEEIREIIAEEIKNTLSSYDSSPGLADFSQRPSEHNKTADDKKSIARDNTVSKDRAEEQVSYESFDFFGNKTGEEKYILNESAGDKTELKDESSQQDLTGDFEKGVIGQLHNLFILYQGEDNLLIIDQHNAHERIIFEELNEKMKQDSSESSMLIAPINLNFSPPEREKFKNVRQKFEEMGFAVEKFGPSSHALTAVPSPIKERCENFSDIIFDLLEDFTPGQEKLKDKMLTITSCRMAVKEGEKLSRKEMEKICDRLFETDNPYRCPHERPILINLGLNELRRQVDRPPE